MLSRIVARTNLASRMVMQSRNKSSLPVYDPFRGSTFMGSVPYLAFFSALFGACLYVSPVRTMSDKMDKWEKE
uniref:Uncharacterized protein n=1 Tax=Pseudodiaptomus poplesia TaxID=213370 RepID=A0A0U2V2C4_9MAXI|nr:hypothetical protein [Pseudodiaptomus poplesia]